MEYGPLVKRLELQEILVASGAGLTLAAPANRATATKPNIKKMPNHKKNASQ